MFYPTFWKDLQTVAGLEKLAESSNEEIAREAQGLLAMNCDRLFTSVKHGSANIASPMMALRDAHRITGEKLAASPEVVATLLQKLATASFVDTQLTVQMSKLAGEELESARSVQLLGREYAVHLMRGILS